MIRKKEEQTGPIVIDLTGPDGNAFALIAYANRFAKQIEMQPKERAQMNTDLMAGDYENLLQVFDKHFGEFVILER
jgi:hypothetical protein